MRLLGLTNFLPPLGYGYGAICDDVMSALGDRGHLVRVLSAAGGSEPALGHVPGAWRRPIAGLRAERRSQRAVRDALGEGVDAAIAWHMRGIGKGSLTLLHDAGIPVVYMLGDLWVVYERPGPPSWWRSWSRIDGIGPYRALRGVLGRLGAVAGVDLRPPPIAAQGHCVFASRWLRDRYAQAGFVPAQQHVIPNGLAQEQVPGARPSADAQRLLFAGRADRSKGADVALDALAELPDATLTVAGEHDAKLGMQARRLGVADRVLILGPVSRERVLGLLAEADVFLMPGRIEEAFGLVYLEAMASGVPVVGTARGGAADFCVDRENCLVVPPEGAAVATAVRELRNDAPLRDQLVAGGRATAEGHALERMVDRIEELLARVAAP